MSALRWLASLLATAALAAASTESCSETWISFGESSFLLSSGNASWFDAFTECHRLGGKLASIQSQRENDFLHVPRRRQVQRLTQAIGIPGEVSHVNADNEATETHESLSLMRNESFSC
ncbi:low affinity immunoglobulin epsilon Fc receptor [Penaeus vannamei]|uniref:Low affinity immunoglobulin epsilon Fc receptor n=1 Tax=Penaeus vannamei TaxID=6689 RepID=A0A3R7MLD0_PENVA|nr:low affinity immunoglobulin epsilon Fc receptor [Penaeus vannamei]